MSSDAYTPDHAAHTAGVAAQAAGGNGAVADDRRAHRRDPVLSFRSNAGVILDASDGGLRIRGVLPRGSRPGSILTIEVESESGDQRLEIAAEIRWIQRQVFRGATFGVAFVSIDERQHATLFSIIRTAEAGARCSWTPGVPGTN